MGYDSRWDATSPLRYPGSKRRLVPQIAAHLGPATHLVEPFAGSAAVSLGMLEMGAVETATICDADPAISDFFTVATTDPDWLIEAMHAETITVDRFDEHKAAAVGDDGSRSPEAVRDRALRTLFLNRTSFSGLLTSNAGPIGGRGQAGRYRIACRFNRDRLTRQIRNLATLATAGRLVVAPTADWSETLAHHPGPAYLDPPYVDKARRLYRRHFDTTDHARLAQTLARRQHWVLSYDNTDTVHELYRDLVERQELNLYHPAHTYTTTGARRAHGPGRELLLVRSPSHAPAHTTREGIHR